MTVQCCSSWERNTFSEHNIAFGGRGIIERPSKRCIAANILKKYISVPRVSTFMSKIVYLVSIYSNGSRSPDRWNYWCEDRLRSLSIVSMCFDHWKVFSYNRWRLLTLFSAIRRSWAIIWKPVFAHLIFYYTTIKTSTTTTTSTSETSFSAHVMVWK